MRLQELHIEGFGHFHDQVVGPLNSNVTVLYGPNEAGKSTLLAFIRTMLFGFPARRRNSHYPPLAGGRHGGRITLEDDEGVRYTLERIAGPRGGPYVLRTESGDTNAGPAVLERLTGHATLDLFSNVFAFSLDEIQNEGLMGDSEVAGRLYSAGMGASGLPELVENLARRRDELFRPRGSAQAIANLLRELNDVDGQLRAVQDNASEYRTRTARQDNILVELEAVEKEISVLNSRRAEIGRLSEGRNDWLKLVEFEARLQMMPEFDGFPDNPIERLEDLEDRVRQAREDRDDAEGELRQVSEALEATIPDENLVDEAERIDAIRRRRSSFDASGRDLPIRQGELQELEDVLSARIRELGNAWNEENLGEFDTSLAVRQQIAVWRDRLNESSDEVKEAGIGLSQSRKLLEEIRQEEEQAQDRLVVGNPSGSPHGPSPASGRLEDLLDDDDELERVRRGRGSFDDSVRDLPERQAELRAQEVDVALKLRDLGKGWDETRLDGFDTSMVFRQSVDEHRQRLVERADSVRRTKERFNREESALIECRAAVDQSRARLPVNQPPLNAQEIERRVTALRTARSRLNDHDRASVNLENLRAQLASLTGSGESTGSASRNRSGLLFPLLPGIAGIVVMLAGLVIGQGSLILGVIAGAVLLGFAGFQLFHRRGTPDSTANPLTEAIANNVKEAETAVDSAKLSLAEVAEQIGLDGVPTADSLDNTEAGLEAASKALSAWDEASSQLEETNHALGVQAKHVAAAEVQAKSAVESAYSSRQAWRQWLKQHGLDEGLNPDTVVELTGRLDTTRAVLQDIRRMRQRVAAIKVDIDEYRRLVKPLADRYGISLNEANPQRIMSVADTLVESLDSVRRLVNERDNLLARLNHQQRTVDAASDEYGGMSKDLESLRSEWRGWLRERRLNENFTPEDLLEFLARAETARGSRTETLRMRSRVAAIKKDIDDFTDRILPLAEIHGIGLNTSDHLQIASAADALISRLGEAQRQVSERKQVRYQEAQQRRRLKQLEQRLVSATSELEGLLAAGTAADAEELRRRARLYQERQKLEEQREECLRNLRRLSGPDERLGAFRDSLAASDPGQLSHESNALMEQINARNQRRNGLREERGRNASEIDRLTGEEESSALRIRRNVLMEQLQEKAREWSRLTLAGSILERTQKKFELERQPSVIQHAEEFFTHVTGQRYRRLFAPVGERTITVTDVSGRERRPSELSRGTREQLYLALRFGLIKEFGEHGERLPVIVDEALVNFDAERANQAAASFAKLSATNQVLVFTCHRAIADTFVNVGASVTEIGASYV